MYIHIAIYGEREKKSLNYRSTSYTTHPIGTASWMLWVIECDLVDSCENELNLEITRGRCAGQSRPLNWQRICAQVANPPCLDICIPFTCTLHFTCDTHSHLFVAFTLPPQSDSPLEDMHSFCSVAPFLFLFTVDSCRGGSKPYGDGEDGVETSEQRLAVARAAGRRGAYREMMYW